MVFINLFSLFAFRFVYNVGINERNFYIPVSFGFNTDGNYTIKIYGGSNDNILFHIGKFADIEQFWKDKDGYNPCGVDISDDNIRIIGNQNVSFSGLIKNAGKYTINVRSCAYFSSNYTIELTFLNPTSKLSSEYQNYLDTFEQQLFSSLILLIVWIINIFQSYFIDKDNNHSFIYHVLITILLLLFVIYQTLLVFEYKSREKSDEITRISIVRPYFESLYEFQLFNTITLILSGFYIIFWLSGLCIFICNFLGSLLLVFLNSTFYFFIVLMIPFVIYLIFGICLIVDSSDKQNALFYFVNFIVLFIHSMVTVFNRREPFNKYNSKSSLNTYDILLMYFLSYQFYFGEKMHSYHIKKIKSYFINYFGKLFGTVVVLPSHMTQIDGTYKNKNIFKTITIPSTATKICDLAFNFCYNLDSVIFEENSQLEIIGNQALARTSIQSIVIPSSVTDICDGAFEQCNSLMRIAFEKNSHLKIIGCSAFSNTSFESILIPSSVIEIGSEAFKFSNLQKIEFEENSQLQKIGYEAFCETLIISIVIPSNVVCIESYIFKDCTELQRVTFEENSHLQIIPTYFVALSSVEYLEIPSSVCQFEKDWCIVTPNLNRVIISPENENFQSFTYYFIGKNNENKDSLYFVSRHYEYFEIPSVAKRFESSCLNCSALRNFYFFENSQLTVINCHALSYSKLEYFQCPSSVATIEEGAFSNCYQLSAVYFPKDSQLQTIGDYAFEKTWLYEITIPSKVKTIGRYAFNECTDLLYVDFLDDSELEIIDKCAFKNSGLLQISIPSHVTKIGDFAFENCQQLQIIEIADNSELKFLNSDIINTYSNTIIMIPSKLNISFI